MPRTGHTPPTRLCSDYVFYSDRLLRLLVEFGLGYLATTPKTVETPVPAVNWTLRFSTIPVLGAVLLVLGLDTTWAGGKFAKQNYLSQRFTLPDVLKELGLEPQSRHEATVQPSLIEKCIINVNHSILMPPPLE